MGNIKIDEIEYNYFLNNVAEYIKKVKELEPKTLSEKSKEIETYIKEQQQLRNLMEERRLYYEFYQRNKEKNKKEANEAYQKYIKCKWEIESLHK